MGNGDILTVQYKVSEEEQKAFERPLAPDYYAYIRNRVTVDFRSLEQPEETVCSLHLLKTMSHDQVSEALAKAVEGLSAEKIRFTQHFAAYDHGRPRRTPIKRSSVKSLEDMLTPENILYYEQLELPLVEIESKKYLKIDWYNSKVERETTVSLLLEKNDHLSDAAEKLKEKLGLPKDTQIRFLDVHYNKIFRTYRFDEPVRPFSEFKSIRAEQIGEDELNAKKSDKLITVCHHDIRYPGSPSERFGD